MFGISAVEFVVVIGILLLFVKPEELPKLLRTLGRYYGQFLEYSHKMRQMGRDTYHEIASMDGEAPTTKEPPPIPEFRRPLDQPSIPDSPEGRPPAPTPRTGAVTDPPPVAPPEPPATPAPAPESPEPPNSRDTPVS